MLLFQKSGTVGRKNGDESKSFKIYYCHIWRSNHPLPAAILGYLGNPRDLGYQDFDLELSQFRSCGCGRPSPRILAILCITMFCTTATCERFNSSFKDHLGVSEMRDTEKKKKWCLIYRVAMGSLFFGHPFLDKLICLRKTSQRKPTINTCSDLLLRLLSSILTDEIVRLVFTHVASGQ